MIPGDRVAPAQEAAPPSRREDILCIRGYVYVCVFECVFVFIYGIVTCMCIRVRICIIMHST